MSSSASGDSGCSLVRLHVIDRAKLLGYIQKARREIIPQYSRRGDIFDSSNTLLATSHSLIVLGVDPQSERPEDAKKWPQLARLAGLPLAEVEKILTTKYRPAPTSTPGGKPEALVLNFRINVPTVSPSAAPASPPEAKTGDGAAEDDGTVLDPAESDGKQPIRWAKLSDEITEPTYAEIMKLGISGIYGNRVYRRIYPHNELAAHLIGYVNQQQTPISSIERYSDFYLRGQDGWVESEKDGHQRELAEFRTREVPAADGYSVVLSIDAKVQGIVEEELRTIAEKFHPQKATIIVSDPRTGFILALANYPTFNLNQYNKLTKDEQKSMHNPAVGDLYEPGSVFKIVAVSGALEAGLVTPDTKFDCTLKSVEYRGRQWNLPREDESDNFTHPLSVADIIAQSSNKGAVQIGMLLGERRWFDFAKAFGFGQPTGFPIGGEPGASVLRNYLPPPIKGPNHDQWDDVRFSRMPMGQSVAVTALQMHQAMSVIASGGVLLRPQIIKRICDSDGNIACRYDTVVERQVISARTAKTMAQLLNGVTMGEGGGVAAAIPGYEVAGKTGTAQKPNPDGHGYLDHHHTVGSFIGFLPASCPQIDISVIVDDGQAPNGTAYGRVVAAPSFKNIALQLINAGYIRRPFAETAQPVLAMEGGQR